MGSTTWEVTRKISMRYALSGIAGAVFLGLGRALGETMAVALIIGGLTTGIPRSLFSQGSSVSATIALNFGESSSKLETSALIELALILFVITMVFQALAQAWLARARACRGAGHERRRERRTAAHETPPGRRPPPDEQLDHRWRVDSGGDRHLHDGLDPRDGHPHGIGAWDWAFFTKLPPQGQYSPGHGIANCIVGTILTAKHRCHFIPRIDAKRQESELRTFKAFCRPSLQEVIDPTGAGDSFAAGSSVILLLRKLLHPPPGVTPSFTAA